MRGFIFDIHTPIAYNETGKFEAPSEMWVHENLDLLDRFEFCLVTKGTLYLSYKEIHYAISEGQFLTMAPSPPPNNRRIGYKQSCCDFFWLHFNPVHEIREADLEHIDISVISDPYQIFIPQQGTLPRPEKASILLQQLQDCVRSNYSVVADNYMTTAILCEIYNQIFIAKPGNSIKSKSKQLCESINSYIKEHADMNLKVNDIAQHFGYNEKYLSKIFKSVTTESIKQRIINIKIEAANYYLTATDLSVAKIAQKIGFIDCHNFMKFYKSKTGLTPTEYRNSFPKRIVNHK